MSSSRKSAYAALLITALIWGIAPPVIKYTLGFISPIGFLFYRFLLVSLILIIPLGLRIKKIKPAKKQWPQYLALGFLGTPLTLSLLFTGMAKATAIAGAVIWVIAPMLVILGGAFWLKDHITTKEKIGIAVVLTGTLITICQPLFSAQARLHQQILGNLLIFLGTIAWASFTLLAKKANLDNFILLSSSFLVGTIILLPLFLSQSNLPPQALPGIIYMAIFGSVIAYGTYLYGHRQIEVSEAALFTYLQPLFGVPLAAVWLKEPIVLPFLVGAALIAAGALIAEQR